MQKYIGRLNDYNDIYIEMSSKGVASAQHKIVQLNKPNQIISPRTFWLKPYVDFVAMSLHFGLGTAQIAALDHQLLRGIHELVLQLEVDILQVF